MRLLTSSLFLLTEITLTRTVMQILTAVTSAIITTKIVFALIRAKFLHKFRNYATLAHIGGRVNHVHHYTSCIQNSRRQSAQYRLLQYSILHILFHLTRPYVNYAFGCNSGIWVLFQKNTLSCFAWVRGGPLLYSANHMSTIYIPEQATVF